MRVLHVLETLSPRYGGPARVLMELVHAQHRAGHEVVVVTTESDHPRGVYHEPGWDTLADGAVRVFYGAVQFAPLRVSLDLARCLRRVITDFEIVHVHGLYRFPATYAAYRARRQGVPYIIRPHGSLDRYLYDRSSRGVWLKRLYERWFDLPNLHGAGAIHYTAEEERQRAAFLRLRAPSFVVPNGIDWARYADLPIRGAFRAAHGLGEGPLLLFLGRLHHKKGLDLLIPAFAEVRRRLPEARLVIVGPENDDYGQRVRGWVREHALGDAVEIIGHLDGADVVQAYVDADVFVLPSYTENFGMTVVEAMACGLPVVISDQVNIHAEVSDAGAGLVTRCDPGEVAHALNTLLGDPARRHGMGAVGRRLARERYTWPQIVGVLTKEYEQVIERNRRKRGAAAQAEASPSHT